MIDSKQINGRKPFSDIPQTRLPLPIATGGIGLLITAISPGGLSGGTGFLIGFIVGLLLIALIIVLSHLSRAKSRTAMVSGEESLLNANETGKTQSLYEQVNLSHER